jgi:hypothetical protein
MAAASVTTAAPWRRAGTLPMGFTARYSGAFMEVP